MCNRPQITVLDILGIISIFALMNIPRCIVPLLLLPVPSLYSVHIEYEYLGKFGNCVDLNTLEDTWYTYPEPDQEFAVTKMALATEELYFAHIRAIGKPCPPGLA